MEALYRQGRLPGAIYSGRGQEGTHVGVAFALGTRATRCSPPTATSPRSSTKGLDLKRVMAQFWGRIDGYTRGRDGNSHIGDWDGNRTFTVISHLPIAYPVALRRRHSPTSVPATAGSRMAICGDGSTSNGRWHESLNWSAVHQLPVVWVVNNNQFAYSTPNPLEFHVPTIAERAVAYGMPGVRVDGGDVLEVYEAARDAVAACPRRRRPHVDRIGLAALARPRGPRPGQVHARRAARASTWPRQDPVKQLRGVDAAPRAS